MSAVANEMCSLAIFFDCFVILMQLRQVINI